MAYRERLFAQNFLIDLEDNMEKNKDALMISYLENRIRLTNIDDMKEIKEIDSLGYADQEIYYTFKNNVVEIIERGRVRKSYSFPEEIIWQFLCVMLKKSIICKLNTRITNQFYEIGANQKRFAELMQEHTNSKFYSVLEVKQGCINIEVGVEPDTFSIFYVYENGDRHYIQENRETPYCFGVFYNFTSSLQRVTKAMEEYEITFAEQLSEECKKIIIDICVLYRDDKYGS